MASNLPPDQPPTSAGAPFPPSVPPAGGGAAPPPELPPMAPLPWEQPGYPLLEALYETGKLVLTKPAEAFARMSTTGDLGRPLVFAVIFGWLGIIASQIYELAFKSAMWSFLPGMEKGRDLGFGPAASVVVMIIAPVLVLLGVFVGSAIIHLFLMLVGGNRGPYTTTVRVVCYAGTPQIIQVIPFCGGIIAAVWTIVLEVIGIAQAHRTTQGKAALAVLLPIVLCCVCVAVIIAIAGAAVMAALGNLR